MPDFSKVVVNYWCDQCGLKYEFGGKDHPYRVGNSLYCPRCCKLN